MQVNRPLGFKIERQDYARRLVIPDIHGCIQSLEGLLNKINLQKSDQLFFLGDFIDRGPSSSGVIKLVSDLQKDDYAIFPLRGNHEQMLLYTALYNPEELENFAKMNNALDLLQKDRLQPEYLNFMSALPYYYELDDFFLVHAGFNFDSPHPFEDYYSMLWIRGFVPHNQWLNDRPVIHGHDPTTMEEIEDSICNRKLKIPLDNGCVHHGIRPGMGNLLCLNLDTLALLIQENIDH